MEVKYPKVKVKLTGSDGNAFAILGKVSGALRHAGVSEGIINNFKTEAMASTYDKLLQVCFDWVVIS